MSPSSAAALRVAWLLGGTRGQAPGSAAVDEAELVDLLVRWRLAGEVAASLREGHGLSRDAVRRLSIERERTAAGAVVRSRTLALAGEALGSAGLPAMMLKGEAVLRLTHCDASRRPMSDLDLLVEPARAEEAVARLAEAGLERSRHDTPMHAVMLHRLPGLERPMVVEVHGDVFEPPHPFGLDPRRWMAGARPAEDSPLLVPDAEDAVVFACLHLAFHEHDASKTLQALRDLAHLQEAGATGAGGALAGEPGVAAVVRAMLVRSAAWAGGPPPEGQAEPAPRWRGWALGFSLREMDAALDDPARPRWRVLGRRLGQALWWPSAGDRVRALVRLGRSAGFSGLARAMRALRKTGGER